MDGSEESRERYLVPGLQRGLEILQCFRADRRRITAAELSQELNIPRSTVFRLLTTLQYMGFLEHSPSGREYSLGTSVLSLGFEYIASLELVDVARPILEKLSASAGHSVHLVIRDGREVVVIFKATGKSFLGSIKVGTRFPAHATILGRMCIAYLDDRELEALYCGVQLQKHSPQTPTTLEDLRTILAEDRKRGYGISEQFFDAGICSVAAPIFEEHGRNAGAINVLVHGVPEPEYLRSMIEPVLAAARELSRNLNYRGELLG
jgi:DNA-binding IclR family transcriptional regulator